MRQKARKGWLGIFVSAVIFCFGFVMALTPVVVLASDKDKDKSENVSEEPPDDGKPGKDKADSGNEEPESVPDEGSGKPDEPAPPDDVDDPVVPDPVPDEGSNEPDSPPDEVDTDDPVPPADEEPSVPQPTDDDEEDPGPVVITPPAQHTPETDNDPEPEPGKVFVCKYVGTPDVDERLQTGDNPISVSVNAIPNFQGVGSYFADAHGRSYVLAFDTGQPEPDVSACPKPDGPDEVVYEVRLVVNLDCEGERVSAWVETDTVYPERAEALISFLDDGIRVDIPEAQLRTDLTPQQRDQLAEPFGGYFEWGAGEVQVPVEVTVNEPPDEDCESTPTTTSPPTTTEPPNTTAPPTTAPPTTAPPTTVPPGTTPTTTPETTVPGEGGTTTTVATPPVIPPTPPAPQTPAVPGDNVDGDPNTGLEDLFDKPGAPYAAILVGGGMMLLSAKSGRKRYLALVKSR